ncbi:MAG: hypothetical protein C4527_15135 [Candidatus Omnitrophota bacterium]|jgi:hypothetical protein|nr:MAG: hypothetical protein C4527_15135 [Candidatus Omnitrophota bacterium]
MSGKYFALAKETLERIRANESKLIHSNDSVIQLQPATRVYPKPEPFIPPFYGRVRDRRAKELIDSGIEPAAAKEQAQTEIIDFYEKIQRGETIKSIHWYPANEAGLVLCIPERAKK